MKTIGTLFSGFGGVDIGAMAAGLSPLWAVEYDPAIADVYRRNIGEHVTVADILQLDPLDFEPVDVLHASPPCPNFSVAKAGAEETENDIALGRKVAEFVEALCPSLFTLENVYGYRKAKSFRLIVKALRRLGYHVRWWHLNAADYGVPQSRKRLILVAAQDFTPRRPDATHRDPATVVDGQLSLFGDALPPWVGWYAAIEDLIPTLPDSAFAPWQLARLPAELRDTVFLDCNTTGLERAEIGKGVRDCAARGGTIPAQVAGGLPRAFIVSNAATEWSDGIFDGAEPALAVSPQTGGRARAFIVDGKLNDNSTSLTTRDGDARSVTVTTSHNNRDVKAFIVSSNTDAGEEPPQRDSATPALTVDSKTSGRVVQMTPRALARFQSIPDWYALPESRVLAAKGIGNAVPPLLYQRVIEAQLS